MKSQVSKKSVITPKSTDKNILIKNLKTSNAKGQFISIDLYVILEGSTMMSSLSQRKLAKTNMKMFHDTARDSKNNLNVQISQAISKPKLNRVKEEVGMHNS